MGELYQYDITIEARRAIKAQVLDNFFIENANTANETSLTPNVHNLYVDDSSTKGRSRANLIIKTLQGKKYEHALKFIFKASNKEGKCEALIAGMELCYMVGFTSVRAYSASQSVVSQLTSEYKPTSTEYMKLLPYQSTFS